jgi:hypothetical protein
MLQDPCYNALQNLVPKFSPFSPVFQKNSHLCGEELFLAVVPCKIGKHQTLEKKNRFSAQKNIKQV